MIDFPDPQPVFRRYTLWQRVYYSGKASNRVPESLLILFFNKMKPYY